MKKIAVFMIVVLLFSVMVGISAFAEVEGENAAPIPTPSPTPILEEVPVPVPEPETEVKVQEETTEETPAESPKPLVENPTESPKPEVTEGDLTEEDPEPKTVANPVEKNPEDEEEKKLNEETEKEAESEVDGEGDPEKAEPEENESKDNPENKEEQKETAEVLNEKTEEKESVPEQAAAANQEQYSLTFSNGVKSFETKGGTQVTIKEILENLGYSVENAVITVNPDSVDTSVIQITESENGLVLTDFGPFAQADRKLVVYIDGEPVELSVEDPKDVAAGEYEATTFSGFFNASTAGQDGHVKLLGNVTIKTNSGNITLSSGVHNLFLNGFTLNLNGGKLVNGSGSTLNIFGGANSTESGNGTIETKSDAEGTVVALGNEGTLNIYSGNVKATATSTEASASAVMNKNVVNICGGNISSISAKGETYSYAINNADKNAKTYVSGGTFKGKLNIPLGTLAISGGRFTADPTDYVANGYIVLDHGTSETYRYEVVKKPVPRIVVDVEVVDETDLNDAQRQSLKKITDKIIHLLRCSFWQEQYSLKTAQKIVIRKALLENIDPEDIRIWHIAEDGTMTEIKFETNSNGELVINSGKPGIYVLTKTDGSSKGK